MHDRARAIQLLKEARDHLADRLTERVLESAEEILDDARGDSFLSEIETIQDEIGSRLTHINQLIANLPPPAPEPVDPNSDSAEDSPVAKTPLALPAPETSVEDEAASFRAFAMAIQLGDVSAAGRQLAGLFEIEPARAERCAAVFLERMREDEEFLTKARRLRQELATGSFNGAIMLLHECFGLQANESIPVVQTLRVRISQLD